MAPKGMQCEYRATHEFGNDGVCNLCFKAKLVAEKEQAVLDRPPEALVPVNIGVDLAVTAGDEPLVPVYSIQAPGKQVFILPTGWDTQVNESMRQAFSNSLASAQANAQAIVNAIPYQRMMPLQELGMLQTQKAWLEVDKKPVPAGMLARIEDLQRQYHPYTKAGLAEQAVEDARIAETYAKQKACDHRALQLSEDGYEADCSLCGKYFDEVELDDLKAERAHLEQVQLKASAKVAALLLPALAKELAVIGTPCKHFDRRYESANSAALICNSCGERFSMEQAFALEQALTVRSCPGAPNGKLTWQAGATKPDGRIACDCGADFPDLGSYTRHRATTGTSR